MVPSLNSNTLSLSPVKRTYPNNCFFLSDIIKFVLLLLHFDIYGVKPQANACTFSLSDIYNMCTIYTYVCIVVEFIFISNDVFSHNAKNGLSQGAPWKELRKIGN